MNTAPGTAMLERFTRLLAIGLCWICVGCQHSTESDSQQSVILEESVDVVIQRLSEELHQWVRGDREHQTKTRTIEFGSIASGQGQQFTLIAAFFPPYQATPKDRCQGLECRILGTAYPLTLRLRATGRAEPESFAEYGATIVWSSQSGQGRIVLSNVFIPPPSDAARLALYGEARSSLEELVAIAAGYLGMNGVELARDALRYDVPINQVPTIHNALSNLFNADLVDGAVRLIPTNLSGYGLDPKTPEAAFVTLGRATQKFVSSNWRDPSSGHYVSYRLGAEIVDRRLREQGHLDPDAGVFPDLAQVLEHISDWLRNGPDLELVAAMPRDQLARAALRAPHPPEFNERERGIKDVITKANGGSIGKQKRLEREFPFQYCDGTLRIKSNTSPEDVALMRWLLESAEATKQFPEQTQRLKQFMTSQQRRLPEASAMNPETEQRLNAALQEAVPPGLRSWFFGAELRRAFAAQSAQLER